MRELARVSELSVAELLEIWPKLKLAELNVADALRIWPKLKRMEGDALLSDSIQLESFLDLESCMEGDWRAAKVVRLLDLPQLSDRIQVSRSLQSLHIQSTPELRGLSTFAPWPADALIEGLGRLETFSAGGPRFQDKEFKAIEAGTGLEALTLAYSGMTPEQLRDIGKFTKLKALGLTGTAVTDATLRNWTEMIVQLANCIPKTIQVIDLCNCKISPRDLSEFIDSIRSDIWLSVEGLDVPSELQASLLRERRVVTDDFSDFFRPDVGNYIQTSVWPQRSESNSTAIVAHTSSLGTQSPIYGRIRWPSTFVKPSLFAPSLD